MLSADIEVIAVTRAFAGRAVIKLLDLLDVGRPFRHVLHVLRDHRPHAFHRRVDVDNLMQIGHTAMIAFR